MTGEPIPVIKARGAATFSGSLNTGDFSFEMAATTVAGENTYEGKYRAPGDGGADCQSAVRAACRTVCAGIPAYHAGASLYRLADILAISLRSLAALVAATPAAHIGCTGRLYRGVAQAARRGILVKGGGPLEALARAHTAPFDKTGTLTWAARGYSRLR